MLLADDRWVRKLTASFYYQVALRLKGQVLRRAQAVRAPALVIQTEGDRAVVPAASQQAYKTLGSADKAWLSIPLLSHDFEFEPDREPLESGIARWVAQHVV
jgi:alpha-beta hydrolase superfamily lysophospholipase